MRSIASWLLLILMLCIGTFLIFGCQKKGPSTEVPTPISYRYTVYWGWITSDASSTRIPSPWILRRGI